MVQVVLCRSVHSCLASAVRLECLKDVCTQFKDGSTRGTHRVGSIGCTCIGGEVGEGGRGEGKGRKRGGGGRGEGKGRRRGEVGREEVKERSGRGNGRGGKGKREEKRGTCKVEEMGG